MPLVSKANPKQEREGNIKRRGNGRKVNENFGKRKRSLVRKGNETGRLYESDVYIAFRCKGKCTIYTNCFSTSWPPRREDMVSGSSLFIAWLT